MALFVFSGYGFLSACLLLIEGPFVCREALKSAENGLTDLQNVAQKHLPVAAYNDLNNRVRARQKTLDSEIFNPAQGGFCGIGPAATQILNEIHNDLPSVHVLAGTTRNHSCADTSYLRGVREAYDNMITEGLRNHAFVTKYRIAQRNELLSKVIATVAEQREVIQEYLGKLAGLSSFIFGNINLYHQTVGVLEKADSEYSNLYSQLSSFVGMKDLAALPPKLGVEQAEKIASPMQVLSLILSRSGSVTTWIYIALAITFDFLAALLASMVFLRCDEIEYLRKRRADATNVGDSDVQYIWVPTPHPATVRK